jgi:hypothetical protein
MARTHLDESLEAAHQPQTPSVRDPPLADLAVAPPNVDAVGWLPFWLAVLMSPSNVDPSTLILITLKSARRLELDAVMRNSSTTDASSGRIKVRPQMTLDSGLIGLVLSSPASVFFAALKA